MHALAFEPWSVAAVNLPEHAGNPIHSDEGARAAGYPAALVAGVTVYAYLTHPPAAAWGIDWVRRGGAEVRFVSPVFDADRVDCVEHIDDGTADEVAAGVRVVEARVDGERRAVATMRREAGGSPVLRDGEPLDDIVVVLSDGWADYGERAGDDLDLYRREGITHPAAWPSIANHVVVQRGLVTSSWVHVRSLITHLDVAPRDAVATVRSTVIKRFETRAGERAVLDVVVETDRGPVVHVEHESIVALR